ncbi:subtilisin family serine protease [Allostreptomyces psammosilenae]|uniref:Subtilisin family serine protease n=1 Tax=Allostreptomyces psammosilenae TaxID=1892865 RepID=A0A853A9S3_9ACTN|nr:S8 family serine peptidase [Allostreptomyces psammosilenae]NYI07258.1 subtilisin family serine protease [Allostreptomyces psammosilenae]
MPPTSRRRRTLAVPLTALTALLGPLLAGAGAAAALPTASAPATAVEEKTEPAVLAELAEDGKTTFWVRLAGAADIDAATAEADSKEERAAAVFRAKTEYAEESQAGLRELLDAVGADYTPFWISNTVQVTGDAKLLATIAELPEVSAVDADEALPLPKPVEGTVEPSVNAVEWNVADIRADDVWADFGVRGEGVVVANIDTGVQFDHPAVAAQYRGRAADGTVSHDYNWFDPAGVCATDAPCDNNNHGTHTMGTMVGDDGGANAIGVAPGAKWIAAKGCESSSCSEASLLAAGQWIVAPTDLAGGNPRPDLAPDVVNNSWGGSGYDPWYSDIVDSWRAAGIFPAFSNGNSGPACNTSGSPGIYPDSYSSGAYDSSGAIASFSSRGAGRDGDIKPNLAAPGVNVRSATAGGGYGSLSGTSMASPHTAAVVALMWSASPALLGDIDATAALLDSTARDAANTTCGGTAADNNVFGEGRIDAYAAVDATPRGALGTIAGTVTAGGAPLAGATVSVEGPLERTVTTAADGTFTLPRLMVGQYAVEVSRFGYFAATGTATVTEEATTTADFTLEQAPSATVSGTVTGAEGPAAGSTVAAAGTPVSATTDAAGHYTLTLPHGSYQLIATPVGRCAGTATAAVEVSGDVVADLALPARTDAYGYACSVGSGGYPAGTTRLSLTGDDVSTPITLPFSVPLYGTTYSRGYVTTNGVLALGATSTTGANRALPYTGTPNGALYPFWDDLYVDASAGVYTATLGTAPNRRFVVEWRDVSFYSDRATRISFSAVIGEDGTVAYHYAGTTGSGAAAGSGATIGLENGAGTDAFQYSLNSAVLTDGFALTLRGTRTGLVRGTVTDANDGLGVAGATVTLTGASTVTATTGEDGSYSLTPPAGDYQVSYEAPFYAPVTETLRVPGGGLAEASAALTTGLVGVAAPADGLTVVVPEGQQRTRALAVDNGGAATPVALSEAVAGEVAEVPWLDARLGTTELSTGAGTTLTVSVDPAGAAPGSVLTAEVLVLSDSGRAPAVSVPVTVVVPRYRVALDSGAGPSTSGVDGAGDTWTGDRAYTAGSYGYQGTSSVRSTSAAIAGTDDPWLYSTAREGMYEYRFDGVPNGTYTVELGFAEPDRNKRPDTRVFDVLIEGTEVLPSLDIALEAGSRTAVQRSYTVEVTDGTLNVRFVSSTGKPLVNAVRVTDRPDLAG